jgi:hypothetical protein
MQTKEPYMIPELKLVGDTSEVVLGSMRVGMDYIGEYVPGGMEFETDQLLVNSR